MSLPSRLFSDSCPRRVSAFVNDVVVDERRGVHDLDHRAVVRAPGGDLPVSGTAGGAGCDQQQHRAKSFAAAPVEVLAGQLERVRGRFPPARPGCSRLWPGPEPGQPPTRRAGSRGSKQTALPDFPRLSHAGGAGFPAGDSPSATVASKKKRRKLASVTASISSRSAERAAARARAVSVTMAGSARRPRCGTGAR